MGHDVTLFASGDSVTSARLVPMCERSLRLDKSCIDQLAHHILMLEQVFRSAHEFDILHFHIDYFHFLLSRRQRLKQVTTLHGRLDIPDLVPLYREFRDMPVVSISDAQRKPLAKANCNLYKYQPETGSYLAFLGRIAPEKRVDRAIHIALETGIPLKIAAKVDKKDDEYYSTMIKPLMNDSLIEFVGEINETEKEKFLGNAYALLFPIDWPEPFGLVMVEAMACGTPIVAFRNGSVDEVMEEGRTGFIVDSTSDAVKAVDAIPRISRKECREAFEERFTANRMASDYEQVYKQLMNSKVSPLEGNRMQWQRN